MEVKIGVQYAARELVVDTNMSVEEIESAVTGALSGDAAVLALTDAKGRKVFVPSAKLSYVELGSPTSGQVGFRS